MEEKKKGKWFKVSFQLVVAIAFFVVAIAMTGLFGLMNGEISNDPLNNPQFISKVVISALINLFALLGIIIYALGKVYEQKEVVKLNDTRTEFNATADHVKIEEFVIEENIIRKRKVYRKNLDIERRNFIKRFKPTLIDKRLWHKGSEHEKMQNEYCLAMMDFQERESDKFIEDNLLYIDVKFPEIHSSMLLSSNMASKQGLNYIHSGLDKSIWWITNVGIKYITSMGLPIVWAMVIIDGFKEPSYEFWLDFAVKMMGMLMSVMSGLMAVNSYTQSFVIPDLEFSIELQRRYAVWKSKQVK